MANQEEACQLLTKLGLTSLQAKAYLTLAHIGTATAKDISAQAQMDRADVYRVIAALQEQSLIIKVIANPLKFRAIPIQEAINILLERKHKESAEIDKQASLLLKQHQSQEIQKETQEKTIQFSLVPSKETHFRILNKLINEAQSIDMSVPFELYRSVEERKLEPCKKFLRKGGKIRTLVHGVKNTEEIRKLHRISQNTPDEGSNQVRFTNRMLVAAFMILDRKKLWIDTRPSIPTYEQPNLFTNSPVIVDLAVRYFEQEWKEDSIEN
jgi:sugar-specific transcriptional regulator TrmB